MGVCVSTNNVVSPQSATENASPQPSPLMVKEKEKENEKDNPDSVAEFIPPLSHAASAPHEKSHHSHHSHHHSHHHSPVLDKQPSHVRKFSVTRSREPHEEQPHDGTGSLKHKREPSAASLRQLAQMHAMERSSHAHGESGNVGNKDKESAEDEDAALKRRHSVPLTQSLRSRRSQSALNLNLELVNEEKPHKGHHKKDKLSASLASGSPLADDDSQSPPQSGLSRSHHKHRQRSQSISNHPGHAEAAAAAAAAAAANGDAVPASLFRSQRSRRGSTSGIGEGTGSFKNSPVLRARRHSVELSMSEIQAVEEKPSIYTKPEFFENHMEQVFEHYSNNEPFLNKRRITKLALDSIDQFRADYEETLRRTNPDLPEEKLMQNLEKDLKTLMPGRNEKEILLSVVNHLMTAMDPQGSGKVGKAAFLVHWRTAHKQLFDLSQVNTTDTNPMQCSIM